MLDPGRVKACVFDAYGTLLDVNSAVAAEAAALDGRADELAALWRRKQLEYSWLRTLMRRQADFAEVTRDALAFSLASLGIADDSLQQRLLAAYDRLAPYPEVPTMLRTLKARGMCTAILSNGTPDMLRTGMAAAGIADCLDEVLSVASVGMFKPAPEVYRLATERLGLAAAEIAFLSANGWDVHGAASFGLQTIWVNRGGGPDERLPGVPAATLRSLAALPELLGLVPRLEEQ